MLGINKAKFVWSFKLCYYCPMKHLALLVLISVTVVASVGFVFMCNGQNTHSICTMSFSDKVNFSVDSINMVIKHMSTYQSFLSSTTVSLFVFTLFFSIIGLVIFLFVNFVVSPNTSNNSSKLFEWVRFSYPLSLYKIKNNSWLSLLENSPSF